MASDSNEPSRRKHHRSSDDDADEPSKRRKHRHHHRHHRHHSKKHQPNSPEKEATESSKREIENGPQIGTVTGVTSLGLDYDMEEGEIIDDDVLATAADAKFDLDTEHEVQGQGHAADNVETVDKNSAASRRHDEQSRSRNNDNSRERKSIDEHLANGSYEVKHDKLDSKLLEEDSYPGEASRKQNSCNDNESDLPDLTKSPTPETTRKRHKSVRVSSPHDAHHEERHVRKLSRSPDRSRGRSRSKSILEEFSVAPKSDKHDDAYEKVSRHRNNLYNERIGHYKDYRHGSRESFRDVEKDRDSSHFKRSSHDDRYYSRESVDRYRENNLENGKDRDPERDRERGREREREERERERVRDKEREREKARDRQREKDRDLEYERERERDRGRRYRDRESRGRSREGDRESRGRSREGDRDRYHDRSSRQRRYDDLDDGYAYNRRNRHHDADTERDRTSDHLKTENAKQKTAETNNEMSKRDEVEQDYQERISFQLAEQEDDELERIKEESRRRRQAILEKYKNQQSQEEQVTQSGHTATAQADQSTPKTAVGDDVKPESLVAQTNGADVHIDESIFSVGKSSPHGGRIDGDQASGAGGLGQGTPKSERSADMFSDDIFGESPAGLRKMGKGDGLAVERSGLHDNWDDPEGYYSYRFGEILDGRYEILAAHGKGVFSTVVRARDLRARPGDPEEVAIKMIRNNETMYKAGMEELVILKKLVGADPENRRHCVRFISSFKYRNHLCLVFESLYMNLREVLKKFGRNIGLSLSAVKVYSQQLFIALKHLKNCGVLHCDIKPDNMLVNETKNVLKLCDFGNAMFAGKNEITPYLVSRFYRAPEIILGLPYDHPMDMWSVGCCLFELYSGKVLFPGPSNNDMLRLHMELKGPFPKKMLRKGAFTDQHFDQDLNFLATEEDPVTKKAIRKLIVNVKPKDISSIISGSSGEDPKMLGHFKDLLERIFVLDPEKRISVSQALNHPFITAK